MKPNDLRIILRNDDMALRYNENYIIDISYNNPIRGNNYTKEEMERDFVFVEGDELWGNDKYLTLSLEETIKLIDRLQEYVDFYKNRK